LPGARRSRGGRHEQPGGKWPAVTPLGPVRGVHHRRRD
jgi:hypothetical protein